MGEALKAEGPHTEARIPDTVLHYWEEIKGDLNYPKQDDVESANISDIWKNCFLIKIEEDGKFVYNFLGSSLVQAYADNLEGEEIVEDLLYPESPELKAKFAELIATKQPVHYEGALINKNNMDIKFRKILLPLGKDGKIDFILGGMRWRAF